MLCYVVSITLFICCILLHYAILCYIVLHDIVLYYIMLYYDMSCYVMIYYIALYSIAFAPLMRPPAPACACVRLHAPLCMPLH